MKKVLTISLILNLLFIIIVALFIFHKGGINYIKSKTGADKTDFPASYYQRLNVLDNLPVVDSAIVFVGNSIVEQCECSELFQNSKVLNRGVSHDNIRGVINRAESIVKLKPAKLFILIGTNDLINGLDSVRFLNDYSEMVDVFKKTIPPENIFLISLLPTNDTTRKTDDIEKANNIVKIISEENFCNFIDIYSGFLKNDVLNNELSFDGLHLNGKGYLLLNSLLLDFLK